MTQEMQPITVYGRPACPMVPPVLYALDTAGVPYTYIDIRQDLDGLERVRAINHGNETVPTLVFPDGTSLTEPRLATLREKLAQTGHDNDALKGVMPQIGFTLRNPVIAMTILGMLAMLVYFLVFA